MYLRKSELGYGLSEYGTPTGWFTEHIMFKDLTSRVRKSNCPSCFVNVTEYLTLQNYPKDWPILDTLFLFCIQQSLIRT